MDKRIKVLALSYLFPNKNQPDHGIFVLNRLKALSKYVDIVVVNPIPWSPIHNMLPRYKVNSDVPQKDEIGGLVVYHPRFFSIPRFFKAQESSSYSRAIRPVIENIRESFDFNIVDMHWTFPDLPAGLAMAKHYNKKSIVTLRGLEAFHQHDTGRRKQIVAEGLKKVDAIVALSSELKQVGDKLSENPNKSVVIRNGVDTGQFHYMHQKDCKKRIGIPEDCVALVSVGSLIHRKGFDLMIRVISDLKSKPGLEKINLYIIGTAGAEGDYSKILIDLVESEGVKKHVEFVGAVPNNELKYWYNACDLFCLASRGEGSPNVLTEALACGCPSVTTNVGSAKEIIESVSGLGECVPVDHVARLSDSIVKTLELKTPRRKNAELFGQYNWDWCAASVLDVYHKVCLGEGS